MRELENNNSERAYKNSIKKKRREEKIEGERK